MAGNSFVQVPPDSTGKKVDCVSLSVGGVDVFRQRICIGDGSSTFETAVVTGGRLLTTVAGQVSVTGSVAISNTVTVQGQVSVTGSVAISNTVTVQGQVSVTGSVALNAGLAHIGQVSVTGSVAISNTVTVQGQVSVTGSVAISNSVNVNGGVAISGTAVCVGSGFFDSSVNSTTTVRVGDSANSSVRVTIAALSATSLPVSGQVSVTGSVAISNTVTVQGQVSVTGSVAISNSVNVNGGVAISGTAVCVSSGFFDSSVNSTTTVRVGDSANLALRVNIVALSAASLPVSGTVNVNGAVAISGVPTVSLSNSIITAGTVLAVGRVGHDAALGTASDKPVLMGMRVALSQTVAAAHNNAVWSWGDGYGRQVVVANHPSNVAGATHGPQSKDITATTMAVMVASVGAASSIYVTALMVTNGSGTLTKCELCSSDQSATPQVVAWLAASGGGYQVKFDPPWKLSVGTALHGRLGSGVTGLSVTAVMHFYVGAG